MRGIKTAYCLIALFCAACVIFSACELQDVVDIIEQIEQLTNGEGDPTSSPTAGTDPINSSVAVATLEEELAGDTYGLLFPKTREAYVGRTYYNFTDVKDMVVQFSAGLNSGIRGLVFTYSSQNYDYWYKKFNDEILNRSEIGGMAINYLVENEGKNVIAFYPQFNHAWNAITYYRFKEPEIDESDMKLLKMAHEVAEEAIKAHPDDYKEILRYVNDKICELTTYSDPIPSGKDVPARDATGVFFNHDAVCEGYTAAFRLVVNILGFENDIICNKVTTHVWNRVKLDGTWYHVDVTWNDSGKKNGKPTYTYFLITDAELEALNAGSDSHDWDKNLYK